MMMKLVATLACLVAVSMAFPLGGLGMYGMYGAGLGMYNPLYAASMYGMYPGMMGGLYPGMMGGLYPGMIGGFYGGMMGGFYPGIMGGMPTFPGVGSSNGNNQQGQF